MSNTDSADLFEVYIKTLENQIENKRYFLEQTEAAISKLQNSNSNDPQPISNEIVQELMKKPMFFPERSDPIGLSLATTSLLTRQKTSEEAINEMESNITNIETMNKYQKTVNTDLKALIGMLEQKSNGSPSNSQENSYQPPMERNRLLWDSLDSFNKEYISVDLADLEDGDDTDVYDHMNALLIKLIQYDTTLKVADFHPYCRGLYRLLLKSNIIVLEEKEDGNRYVKLLDFSITDIS